MEKGEKQLFIDVVNISCLVIKVKKNNCKIYKNVIKKLIICKIDILNISIIKILN